jgi:hypothetical protein
MQDTESVAGISPEQERPETRAEKIRAALEALLFTSARPVSEKDLADVREPPATPSEERWARSARRGTIRSTESCSSRSRVAGG